MAKPKIPSALEMRELKYGDMTDDDRDAVARELREADRRSEAILLFDGRPDASFLREERNWAEREGAAFHLKALEQLGMEISPEVWTACAAAAERKARWMDARSCYLTLEDEAALARIAEHLPESLRPVEEDA